MVVRVKDARKSGFKFDRMRNTEKPSCSIFAMVIYVWSRNEEKLPTVNVKNHHKNIKIFGSNFICSRSMKLTSTARELNTSNAFINAHVSKLFKKCGYFTVLQRKKTEKQK